MPKTAAPGAMMGPVLFPQAPIAAGADGAPGGWALAVLTQDPEGRRATALRLVETVEDLAVAGCPVAVDIPIGLPDQAGFRPCDAAARRLLGALRSSVFAVPARWMLSAGSYADIRREVSQARIDDPGIASVSAQAAALLPKIREVDAWLRGHPGDVDRLFECHPEVSFARMAGGPPPYPKATPAGVLWRLDVVTAAFPDAPQQLRGLSTRGVAIQDALDAYAALAVACRHVDGAAHELGDRAPDSCGLPMRIVV